VKLNGLENDQATGAELSIKDYNQLNEVLRSVTKKVNKHLDTYGETYCSATVEELNPQIFSWLELLDLNVWIILALMVCVTGFTMISGLLIIILERVQMIGVLKALGARNGMVRHTFMWFAVFIIGKGMIIGNILGIGICLIQYYTGIVKLDPTIYYVAEAPVEINIPLFLLVNIATLLVSVLILIVPSFLASNIRPAQSMRYE
jgi:lipoprotein-releasing system permease protein